LERRIPTHAVERPCGNREMVQSIAAAQYNRAMAYVPGISEARARAEVMFAYRNQVVAYSHLVRRHPLHADRRVAVDDRLSGVAALD